MVKKFANTVFLIFGLICGSFNFAIAGSQSSIFYVDASQGDDANSGMATNQAWKSIQRANLKLLKPGDKLLFRAGQSWNGTLSPQGSGSEGLPIEIGSYGEGSRPAIHGQGAVSAILLDNMEYVVLRDLEVTNYSATEENGMKIDVWEERNITDWFKHPNPPQYVSGNTRRFGVKISACDMGEINHVHLINLHVHGVNGEINQQKNDTKNNGGIYIEITGSNVPTYFNDLKIEGCHIHDVDRTGLSNNSSWGNRNNNSDGNWTPSLNVVVRNNIIERAGANGLIVRVAKAPLIENNLFNQNGIKGSGNAAFNFNTDDALWQYNESCFTKKNQNDADAGGIDSDYLTRNTIIQYNYLHDNDFGMLVTGGPEKGSDFNNNTIVRYNVFEREGGVPQDKYFRFCIKIGGNATNTYIHNNVFYIPSEQEKTAIVYHKFWGGNPIKTYYFNNIFYCEGNNHFSYSGDSFDEQFQNNLFFGNSTISWPDTSKSVMADPKFETLNKGPKGYRLLAGSPAIAAGTRLKEINYPDADFYGNPILKGTVLDIGIHQTSTVLSHKQLEENLHQSNLSIFPTLIYDSVTIELSGWETNKVEVILIGLNGFSQLIATEILEGGNGTFCYDLQHLVDTTGMYTLMVKSENKSMNRKILFTKSS
jgi:hypothetical protein